MTMGKKEDRAILARAKELRELLAEFNIRLTGFDPGFTGFRADPLEDGTRSTGGTIRVEHFELKWIEPLLKELRDYRRGAARLTFPGIKEFDRQITLARKKEEEERKKLMNFSQWVSIRHPRRRGSLKRSK